MHAFDEMFEALADAVANPRGYEAGRDVRAHYQAYAQWLATQSAVVALGFFLHVLHQRQHLLAAAQAVFTRVGEGDAACGAL